MAHFNGTRRPNEPARPDALCRHEDVSGRTADEAGPDEHGGVNREPRAVSRSPSRGVRGRACPPTASSRAFRPNGSCAKPCGTFCRRRSSSGPRWAFPCRSDHGCGNGWDDPIRDVLLDRRARERGIFEPAGGRAPARTAAAPPLVTARTPMRCGRLLNLELWYRTFIDGDGVQTLPLPTAAPARRDSRARTPCVRHPEPCASSGSPRTCCCRSTRAASCAPGT